MELQQFTSVDQINDTTAENENVLLIISRANCPGCDNLARALATNVELQTALAGVTVGVVKLETVPTIAATFGVRMAPSMILFRGDDEVKRIMGFNSPAELLNAARAAFGAPVAEAA